MNAFSCSQEEFLTGSGSLITSAEFVTTTTGAVESSCITCSYIVPPNTTIIDGAALRIKPGDVIGLSANTVYSTLTFRNIVGTQENPVIIKNCGGVVRINAAGKPDGIKTQSSRHFRITGGDSDQVYGIKVTGGHMGINLGGLSTDFEVDHIEITGSGFAGIMAKTDPGCDQATWRGNFLMKNVALHHNLITKTGGEGIYAGNSFFAGMTTSCGVKLPHEIHNISIYSNILRETGWDAIQVGCATQGANIQGNIIEDYGVLNEKSQNNGIQIGSGTGGLCHNNLIRRGAGHGLIVLGLGDNVVYNNIVDEAGICGIFCDERYTPGSGFKFINNTIINPKSDGIRIYADEVPMNVIVNNVIANPGSYRTYTYPRVPADAFIYRLNDNVKIQLANNYFTTTTDSLKIIDPFSLNYRVDVNSPLVDRGTNISPYCNIDTDFYHKSRLRGSQYDVGAVESPTPTAPNAAPVANAGRDITLTLPVNSTALYGAASDNDGTIVSYQWTQYGGLPTTIENGTTANARVSGLTAGRYYFRLTVTDDEGAKDEDNILVLVVQPNVGPTAYAGPDLKLQLPNNTIKLAGSAKDADGSIVSYSWSQYNGPAAKISGANTPSATITVSSAGRYYFRLTVKDNDGATHVDNVMLTVLAPVTSVSTLQSGQPESLLVATWKSIADLPERKNKTS